MQRYAKAYAWFQGKDRVELSDLKTVVPYLLWHKIEPSAKAYAENERFHNDRIAFVDALVGKIEGEYTEVCTSDAFRKYATAIEVIRTGKIPGTEETLERDKLRGLVRNAISSIGTLDKPYAITLANHLASEYNERNNRNQNTQGG